MTFRSHISNAVASITVQAPEVIASVIRADCAKPGEHTLRHLKEVREFLIDMTVEINRAIAEEAADAPMRKGLEVVR